MAELVQFKATDEAQQAVIELLEETLLKARAGEVRDIAIVAAIRDEDGPQHWHGYYGQEAFAVLVAGVAALGFSLQYERHKEHEGR